MRGKNITIFFVRFFFVLVLAYPDIISAETGDFSISNLSYKVLGDVTYNQVMRKMICYIDEPRHATGSGDSLRVNFAVKKTLNRDEVEYIELYTVKDGVETYITSKGREEGEEGEGVCTTLGSQKSRHYPSFIEYSFKERGTNFDYDEVVVKAYDYKKNEMMRFIGEKPKLEITLEKDEESRQGDKVHHKLLLKNNHRSKSMKVIGMQIRPDAYFDVPDRSDNLSLKPSETREFEIKAKHGVYGISSDTVLIDCQIEGSRFTFRVGVSIDFDNQDSGQIDLKKYKRALHDKNFYKEVLNECYRDSRNDRSKNRELSNENGGLRDSYERCQALSERNKDRLRSMNYPGQILYRVNKIDAGGLVSGYEGRDFNQLVREQADYIANQLNEINKMLIERLEEDTKMGSFRTILKKPSTTDEYLTVTRAFDIRGLEKSLAEYRKKCLDDKEWLLEKGVDFRYGEEFEGDIYVKVVVEDSASDKDIMDAIAEEMERMIDETKNHYEDTRQMVNEIKASESWWAKTYNYGIVVAGTAIATAAATFFITVSVCGSSECFVGSSCGSWCKWGKVGIKN